MKKINAFLATSGLALVVASPGQAQTRDEAASADDGAIVVTAQRRSELTQDVPISITSISAETLRQANVQQLSDIAKLSPATRFDYQGNFVQPTIRGIGTAVVTSGGGANVGIYTDGFYSPNPLAADFQLLNVQSIQVLKGPQGTLFGRNTTGGAILVTTNKPSEELKAITELGYERFNTSRAQAYVSTGLAKGIAVDLEGGYMRSDGYFRNLAPDGDPNVGGYTNWSVRAGANFELSDKVSFLARYSHRSVDDGTNTATGILVQDGVTYSSLRSAVPASQFPDGYREISLNEPARFKFKSDIFQLTGSFDFSFADLTSYTQYRREQGSTYQDQDQTPIPIVSLLIPVVNRTFTQELLLTSKPGARLSWTAGAFYFRNRDTFDDVQLAVGGSPFFVFAGSSSVVKSTAVYLDATYEIANHLFMTGGARYSHDVYGNALQYNITLPAPLNPPAVKNNPVTPRVVLRYEVSNDASIYASFTRGYKAGLIDLVRETGPGPVNPESINAFEAGFKYATRGLSFNLAAWHYDYKDLQVSSYLPASTGGFLAQIDNAATARIYGVEGDIRYQVTPDFSIGASGAYVNAKYKSFPTSNRFVFDSTGTLVPQVPFDSSGLQMQRAPKFTAALDARYGFDLGGGRVGLSGNYYYTSKVFFDAAEQFRQDGYGLLGLRADWTDPSDQLTLAIYGQNVTGAKYLKSFQTGGFAAGWGAPMTWGVSLRYNYRQ